MKKKKDKIKMGLRIPRPLGTTLQNLNILKEDKEDKKKILKDKQIQNVIDLYTQRGMLSDTGNVIRIDELSAYLNIASIEVMKRMNKGMQRLANLFGNEEHLKVIAGGFQLSAIQKIMEGHHQAQYQLHILMASQGNEYQAFMSSEVNKAIANSTNATKLMIDMIKVLNPAPVGNININPIGTQNNQTNTYLTPDEAIKIIAGHDESLLTNSGLLNDKWAELNRTNLLPDINAKNDVAVKDIIMASNNNDGPIKIDRTHDNRRQIENEILDADDFIG